MIAIGPKVIVAAAVTLALGAGTGIAAAAMMTSASPVDSSGVIHGCWTNRAINGSHVFVLQNAGTNCPKGTTAISWAREVRPGYQDRLARLGARTRLAGCPRWISSTASRVITDRGPRA
jgi:hypothetical protein